MVRAANRNGSPLNQINERMNMMVACADEAHRHRRSDKRTMAYLNEFYRVHAELANRTFDFITRHNLKAQFDEEENGVAIAAKQRQKRTRNGCGRMVQCFAPNAVPRIRSNLHSVITAVKRFCNHRTEESSRKTGTRRCERPN